MKEYVDQIDYVVKKIGIDHVGISSDFNHGGGVIGWDNVGESLNVTAELQRRGYSDADIAKQWGGASPERMAGGGLGERGRPTCDARHKIRIRSIII